MNSIKPILCSFIPGSILLCSVCFGHGLIESPASRNYFCGVITKPHQSGTPDAEYPICAKAFEGTGTEGYNFMSVLTHTRGRLRPLPTLPPGQTPPANETGGVTPALAANVCGYDSESFNNGPTVWDKAIDWPTNNIQPGRNRITWNISWGPHFSDTQEFHYWVTKPGFQFNADEPLKWSDFEEQPFCRLTYDHAVPDGNKDVVARVEETKFDTYCDIPARSGRHVIYAEWGRNYFTWERFHGCVDVSFGGDVIDAEIAVQPPGNLLGAGSSVLDGSQSIGNNLQYAWSISGQTTDSAYTLSTPFAETTGLTFTDPSSAGTVTINLSVSSNGQTAIEAVTLNHLPETAGSNWQLEKPLTDPRTLQIGAKASLRVVLGNGNDIYIPQPPMAITTENLAADTWPLALAQQINNTGGDIAVGVLNTSDQVIPIKSDSANNIYSKITADIASVFLQIEPAVNTGNCRYEVTSQWDTGFNGKILITNNGTTTIEGWTVNWRYTDGTVIEQSWSAAISGNYSASNLDWNRNIEPGATVEFGFTGKKGGSTAQIPSVTGSICQ